jgi:sec-independent protein translocase protein TatA
MLRTEVRAVLSSIFSGGNDLIVILVAVVVLFGGTQLPKLARNTGEALREFRKSHSEAEAASAVSTPVTPPVTPALPPTAQVNGVNQVLAAPPAADSVTLTREELDAIVADRVARSQAEGPKAGS